jgi:hypothetical protein
MEMHKGGISIWFFIGISLLVNGVMITSAGISQIINPPAPDKRVVLFQYHANVWWGALLLILGLVYCIKYYPRRNAD